jgi:6-phosphogluconate dehydrogenase
MATADIGLIGLAVMGSNLALNIAEKGYTVAVHNRSAGRIDEFVAEAKAQGLDQNTIPKYDLAEFVQAVKAPRSIIIMVKAGQPVDDMIEQLLPHLSPGDAIIECGNSLYTDTQRRFDYLKPKNIGYLGVGVSGGEEGARHGPSIMVGGSKEQWHNAEAVLTAIAAKFNGESCCAYLGEGGAGHFVKMIHNGIEYADMQLIAEAYDLLRNVAGLSADEIADVFTEWNKGELESYLIEITAEVLRQKDAETGKPLVDVILDAAGSKGTGVWTVQTALGLGVPVSGIAEAVFARAVSSKPAQRAAAADLPGPAQAVAIEDRAAFIEDVRQALYASKIVAYSQGFDAIIEGAKEYGWDIKKGDIAKIWRAGCIIRAQFLNRITEAYAQDNDLVVLLAAPYFTDAVTKAEQAWRRVVVKAVESGIPSPAFSSSLAYYDGLRAERLPAALVQGQRDFFGAHTYRRIDKEGTFHTLWSGDRSEVSAQDTH